MADIKKAAKALAVVGVLGAGIAAQPGQAHAAATGCAAATATGLTASVGGFSFGVPQGQYCVNISGTRTYVDYVWTQFSMASPLCYYSVTAEFFDTSWRWYNTRQGAMTSRCTIADNGWYNANMVISIKGQVRPGFMCSTLKSGGTRVTSKCFAITA